jgi:hypothetical protein
LKLYYHNCVAKNAFSKQLQRGITFTLKIIRVRIQSFPPNHKCLKLHFAVIIHIEPLYFDLTRENHAYNSYTKINC